MVSKKDYEDDERIILLNDFDEGAISTAVHSLFGFAQRDKEAPIYIIINTLGGSIYDMLALYDAIKYVQSLGVSVNTIGLGKIMSAGVIILAAGTARQIGKNSTIMWHWGSSELEGDILNMENELTEFKRIETLCNDILSNNTKITKTKMNELLSSRVDVYITPEQAIEYGIVDGYLDMAKAKTKPASTTKQTKTTKRS